jgi:CO/xanthine dehydrogenase FAD-binding subunit
VKPAPLSYRRAESVEHAVTLLGEYGDDARVLAGGQSLMPLVNMRRLTPRVLVDITRVPGLDRVDGAEVGALVTQFALAEQPSLDEAIGECLPYTGHYATRHRGTIGGSIAFGEPRGELPLVLLTLGGAASVRSVGGQREIEAEVLYTGAYTTTVKADELLVWTRWPRAHRGEGRAFTELAQRHGDFTLACACAVVTVDRGEIVAARIGVGAVADRPLLVDGAARALIGSSAAGAGAQDAIAAAADATTREIDAYDDHHASARYRRHLAGALVADAARRALDRARCA